MLESIVKTELEEELLEKGDALLSPLGYRIVDLDCRLGSKSLLRIFIERLSSPGESVSLQDCVTASRALNEWLETFDGIPGAFDLEVSSPGLDRRLRLRSDFESNQGQEVHLKLIEKLEGLGAQVRGELVNADTEKVLIGLDKKQVGVPWANIKQANRIWKTE